MSTKILISVLLFVCSMNLAFGDDSTTLNPTTTKPHQKITTPRPTISDDALEKALHDKRYLMRQLKCALGEVPCDPVGKRLKSLAPLVLRGACPKCTEVETRQIKMTLAHLQKNFPAEWNKLIQTYNG